MTDYTWEPSAYEESREAYCIAFAEKDIDVIMTVATKGIPIANAVASVFKCARCDCADGTVV